MRATYKNKIALAYMIATAVVITLVYITIYFIVKNTVYANLDYGLSFEAKKHSTEITIDNDRIKFINKAEWTEREHSEVQVNPVFIQLIDTNGKVMDKSPNLKEYDLIYSKAQLSNFHFNTFLNDRKIRQVQLPLMHDNKVKGYILAAVSLDSSIMVLNNLRNILLISLPLILIGLFFISRLLAGRSIAPVKEIISTTEGISRYNLNERVEMPKSKDELYDLSNAINGLLDRIQSAISRERQFTSDASHELRTPLASLKGTLEVLIRKPRTQTEYVEKIHSSLKQVDHMTNTLDQLLVLARFDKVQGENSDLKGSIIDIIDEILRRQKNNFALKKLKVKVANTASVIQDVPIYYSTLILENIISNAIKYACMDTQINIDIGSEGQRLFCKITDNGLGIKKEDLGQIFNPFFRSDALSHKEISGNGLGLSIAQKAAASISASISVESILNAGTTFTILF